MPRSLEGFLVGFDPKLKRIASSIASKRGFPKHLTDDFEQVGRVAICKSYYLIEAARSPDALAYDICSKAIESEARRFKFTGAVEESMLIDSFERELFPALEAEQAQVLISEMAADGRLTPMECMVLLQTMNGANSTDTGTVLGMSPKTARVHLANARAKLRKEWDAA